MSLMFPALAGKFFTTSATWEAPGPLGDAQKSLTGDTPLLSFAMGRFCCPLGHVQPSGGDECQQSCTHHLGIRHGRGEGAVGWV